MADVKTRKFIAVTRGTTEESLKALNIAAKVLARRSNAIWDVLLATEESAMALASNILTIKSLHLQIEYMGTWKTQITLHGVPMYITGDFFSDYRPVEEVSSIKSRAGITTSNFEVKNIMRCQRC